MLRAILSRTSQQARERRSPHLFDFAAVDGSTTTRSGHPLALTRASGRTVLDTQGRPTTLVHSQWPWAGVYDSTALAWEFALASARATTNLCLQSENFGTTWAAIGTPTRSAAAKRCGDVVLDLLGDDAGGALEGYSQVITFTGAAVKVFTIWLAAGTSTSTVVRLRDTTAGANRLLATIAWASGVPTVTMTTGTDLGVIPGPDGAYLFQLQTTSVTAANTNQVELYPATTSGLATGNTGTVYAGGVQVQNAAWPGPYVKTTTSTASSNADVITATWEALPQDCTVFVRVAVPSHRAAYSGLGGALFCLGNSASGAGIYASLTASGLSATITDGTTPVSQTAALTAGALADVAIHYNNVRSGARVRIDTGGGYGSFSSASGAISAWASTTLRLAHAEDGGGVAYQLDSGLVRLTIAAGARTLAELQGVHR